MDEIVLIRLALVTSIIGFVGLLALVFFQKPVLAQPTQDILTTMDVKVLDIYQTGSGSVVTYATSSTGYIDSFVSEAIIGQQATITGRLEGDFFSITSIEILP